MSLSGATDTSIEKQPTCPNLEYLDVVDGRVVVKGTKSTPAFDSTGPSGIGGWLLLPILGFGLAIARFAWDYLVDMDWSIYGAVFGTTALEVTLRVLLALVVISEGLVAACAAYCLYLIYSLRPRDVVLRFATSFYLLLIVASALSLWTAIMLEQSTGHQPVTSEAVRDAVRSVVAACIWIPYFHMSKRVRNTFP